MNETPLKLKPTVINEAHCMLTKDSCTRLQESVDILVSKSEKYFYNCEYAKCLKVLQE